MINVSLEDTILCLIGIVALFVYVHFCMRELGNRLTQLESQGVAGKTASACVRRESICLEECRGDIRALKNTAVECIKEIAECQENVEHRRTDIERLNSTCHTHEAAVQKTAEELEEITEDLNNLRLRLETLEKMHGIFRDALSIARAYEKVGPHTSIGEAQRLLFKDL